MQYNLLQSTRVMEKRIRIFSGYVTAMSPITAGTILLSLLMLLSFSIYEYKKGKSDSPISGTIASVILISTSPIFGFLSFSLILESNFRSEPTVGLIIAGVLFTLALYTYLEEPFSSTEVK